jgi:hypothetical protein
MRRLDDAMKLGSPPHIRFKIDDAGAAIASRLAHGHKTVTASTSPGCADAGIKRLDAAITWLVSSTAEICRAAGTRDSALVTHDPMRKSARALMCTILNTGRHGSHLHEPRRLGGASQNLDRAHSWLNWVYPLIATEDFTAGLAAPHRIHQGCALCQSEGGFLPPGSILEDRASSSRGRLGSGEKLLAGLVNHVTRVARSRE